MPGNSNLRRRPSTPNLKISPSRLQLERLHTADPTSPPETPETSPAWARKMSLKPRHQPPYLDSLAQAFAQDSSIRPVGDGHSFSYRPKAGPEQLSPRSASSPSEAPEDSDDEYAEDQSADKSNNEASRVDVLQDESQQEDPSDDDSTSDESDLRASAHVTSSTSTYIYNFVIEDMDPMDSECEGLEVLMPTEIESIRSRSRSRQRGLDKSIMNDLRNLNCSNEASENENEADIEADIAADEAAFLERQKELKRIRRVSMSSSFGKRTHSEISDSDDDSGPLDVNEMGASARHMRKRLHRGSLLFQDPPAPRIDELDEPNSSDDEFAAEQSLAQELPYWAMEIMEADSS